MAEACSIEAQNDHAATIAALREHGAEHFDPVRFHFIEALARRVEGYQGEARKLLDSRLAETLQEYSGRFEQAPGNAGEVVAQSGQDERSPLAELAAYIEQRSSVDAVLRVAADGESAINSPTNSPAETSTELKSVRYFRDTWSKLSVDQQLVQALAQAPQNAGPLNPHLLVLRAFERMRDISPEYLNHFMSYVDALLWLDQADSSKAPSSGR